MKRMILATIGAIALSLFAHSSLAAAPRPNILIILSDDMGFSDIGCYGSEIHTPNLDRLASGGLRFTQFYNNARCCPSRTSILTGLYAHQAGIGHMTEDLELEGYVGDLNNHCVTIAQVLKPAGYATYAVGKWHVTRFVKPDGPKHNWPLQRGFDHYYGTITGAGSYWDPAHLTRDNTVISPFVDPNLHLDPYYYTDAIADSACQDITEHFQSNPQQPFFMYVAFTAAHWPMHAKPSDIAKYHGMYDNGYEPIRQARFAREKELGLINPNWDLSPQWGKWDKVKNKEWEARCMEVYSAAIDCMDQGIGRIVDALQRSGHLDDTLILFLEDNGGNLEATGRQGTAQRADHPTMPKLDPSYVQLDMIPKSSRDGYPVLQGTGVLPGPADTFIAYGQSWANVSNTPFREYKHFVHEGGISTPLVAHWPDGIHRHNELEKQPGHIIDLMTTCVDLAGASYPKQFNGNDIYPMEGTSLVPAFEGQSLDRKQPIFWEHEGNRAMRLGKWKLVAKHPSGKWELYDMDADRTEMHDLASAQPDRTKEMAEQWEAWAKRVHALPWPWKPPYGQKLGSDAMSFSLSQGDDLSGNDVPMFVGRALAISATVSKIGNGVIIAQGGPVVGYSVYIKDNHLHFTTRNDRMPTTIVDENPLPEAPIEIRATLDKMGTMMLMVNGKMVATGQADGALASMPGDGLQVGRDKGGAVGDYRSPFAFKGAIEKAKVELFDGPIPGEPK